MSEAELQAIRERAANSQNYWGFGLAACDDVNDLLSYVDFLHALLHDLSQESSAYQRGVEVGRRLEREERQRNRILGPGTFTAAIVDGSLVVQHKPEPTRDAHLVRIPDVPDTHEV